MLNPFSKHTGYYFLPTAQPLPPSVLNPLPLLASPTILWDVLSSRFGEPPSRIWLAKFTIVAMKLETTLIKIVTSTAFSVTLEVIWYARFTSVPIIPTVSALATVFCAVRVVGTDSPWLTAKGL